MSNKIQINLLLFGITADLIKNTSLEMEVKEAISISEFKLLLQEKYPQLKNINSYAIAVNENYASDALILKNNDVVAIIPPVSGG